MAIIPFPAVVPASVGLQLVSNTATSKSPFDHTVQTSERPGTLWHASLSFTKVAPAQARVLIAFLARLRGQSGRFYLYDHTQPTPRGSITGAPIVAGAAQAGSVITTKGWTGSLLDGDMIGIGGELKLVTGDVVGAGATPVSIAFEPPLRAAPLDGSEIVINKPAAKFKLTGDNQAAWRVHPYNYDLHLIGEETP